MSAIVVAGTTMPRASSARVILYSRARRAQRIVREIDFISCFAPITRALNTYIAPRHSYVPAPQFQGRQGPCIKHACSIKRANVRRATRRHPPSTNRRRSLSSIFETKKRETGKKNTGKINRIESPISRVLQIVTTPSRASIEQSIDHRERIFSQFPDAHSPARVPLRNLSAGPPETLLLRTLFGATNNVAFTVVRSFAI